MYLSIQQDICDIYDQNNMTEINSFAIYPWQKQSVYGTFQEIILPTTWKKIPSGWVTPEIILLNDLKTPQKWRLAFPGPLRCHTPGVFDFIGFFNNLEKLFILTAWSMMHIVKHVLDCSCWPISVYGNRQNGRHFN